MAEPVIPSPKADAPPKPASEFEAYRQAINGGALLQAAVALTGDAGAAGISHVLSTARFAEAQKQYAIVKPEDITRGEGPGFQAAFDKLYREQRLPSIEHPTRVGLMAMEDTPKKTNGLMLYAHGHAVAAYGMAASKAITGNDYSLSLINRVPWEKHLGSTWTDWGGEWSRDLAEGFLKEKYKENHVNVISVSMAIQSLELKDAAMRLKAEKAVSNYFGDNTAFIIAAGNNNIEEDPKYRHHALWCHPRSLLVGAAEATEHRAPDGSTYHAYSISEYSAKGADVIEVASPPGASYIDFTSLGGGHIPLQGTSFSAPQSNSAVAHLMRRFVASETNPSAVLSMEDVLLAVKNTAQPLHTMMSREEQGLDFSHIPFTIRSPKDSMKLIYLHKVGDRFVSTEAGNGIVDPQCAWKLLEKQENAVHEGKAKIIARQNVTYAIPADHQRVNGNSYGGIIAARTNGSLYRYSIHVPDALVADQIVVDAQSMSLSRGLMNEPEARPRIFLVNPAGNVIEIKPSGSYFISDSYLASDQPNSYVIGRAAGMQGVSMQGEWSLLTTEKLDKAEIRFNNAMHPEHVAAAILPDAQERIRTLYDHVDFSQLPRQILAERFLDARSSVLKHDLSKTGLPPHYLDLRLAWATENDKTLAIKLLNSRYATFPDKDALAKAIEAKDGTKVLDTLIPPSERFEAFRQLAKAESKDGLLFLVKKGFATLTEKTPDGAIASTALIELARQRGDRLEPDLINAFIDAGADAKARDAEGRTALHYTRNSASQAMLIQKDRQYAPGTSLSELKDKDGKTYLEYLRPPALLPMPAPAPKRETHGSLSPAGHSYCAVPAELDEIFASPSPAPVIASIGVKR